MIPNDYIQAWSNIAPWPDSRQIEQDLIISRALCDLFNAPALQGKLAFRGGTAINKLLFTQPLRYSEDIDLVQTHAEPIGATVDAIRSALSWLGSFQSKQAGHSMHLLYRFSPETNPQETLKLKVEINTREHEPLFSIKKYPFSVGNDWYTGNTQIASYEPEEMFGTKLRALLQRRKNRDLFDLHHGLKLLSMNTEKLLACFDHYLTLDGKSIPRAHAEQRMLEKLTRSLTEDIEPLLPLGVSFNDEEALRAFTDIWNRLITRIKGKPWKRTEEVLEKLSLNRSLKLFRVDLPGLRNPGDLELKACRLQASSHRAKAVLYRGFCSFRRDRRGGQGFLDSECGLG